MDKKAILFDLDGTLWDASIPVGEAWQATGRKYIGPSFSFSAEEARSEMGKTMEDILKEFVAKVGDEALGRKIALEAYEDENDYLFEHPGKLYPMEEETLAALKKMGYSLYVVSNAQTGYIETYLHALIHPEVYSGHLCYGDTLLPKDRTMAILLEREGIEKKNACYVGDIQRDEDSTHLAGLSFIHAAYGFGTSAHPEGVIASFEEILQVAPKVLPFD